MWRLESCFKVAYNPGRSAGARRRKGQCVFYFPSIRRQRGFSHKVTTINNNNGNGPRISGKRRKRLQSAGEKVRRSDQWTSWDGAWRDSGQGGSIKLEEGTGPPGGILPRGFNVYLGGGPAFFTLTSRPYNDHVARRRPYYHPVCLPMIFWVADINIDTPPRIQDSYVACKLIDGVMIFAG